MVYRIERFERSNRRTSSNPHIHRLFPSLIFDKRFTGSYSVSKGLSGVLTTEERREQVLKRAKAVFDILLAPFLVSRVERVGYERLYLTLPAHEAGFGEKTLVNKLSSGERLYQAKTPIAENTVVKKQTILFILIAKKTIWHSL